MCTATLWFVIVLMSTSISVLIGVSYGRGVCVPAREAGLLEVDSVFIGGESLVHILCVV